MELPYVHVAPGRLRNAEAKKSRAAVGLGTVRVSLIVDVPGSIRCPRSEAVLSKPSATLRQRFAI
jgi:hypothetical protein